MSAVNLPNSITVTRIFSIPLLIWILSTSRFHGTGGEKELLASALFIAASITDGIDGYLARKRGQITTIGMLLDPLADKLLIAAAFVTLVQFNPRDRKSTRLNSSHSQISYAVFCLKKKKNNI